LHAWRINLTPAGLGDVGVEIPDFDTSLGTFNSGVLAGLSNFNISWHFDYGPSSGAAVWWGAVPAVGAGGGDTYTYGVPGIATYTSGNLTYQITGQQTFSGGIGGTGAATWFPQAWIRDWGMTSGSATGSYSGSLSMTYDYTPTATISGSLSIGTGAGSNEIYTHDCSTLTITSDLVVGDAGTSTFNQNCGLITVQGNTILGKQSTGNGTYNLSSNGRLVTNNDLIVGKYGTGAFNQSGGTNTVSGTLRIAKETGSQGTYTLSGGSLIAASAVNNGTFNFTGGTASVSTLTGTGATAVGSGRSLALNQLRQGSLTVNGSIAIASSGGNAGTVIVNSLSIGASGKLDLNDNDLVVNNGVFSTIQGLVFAGYGAGPDTSLIGITSTAGQNVSGVTILALFNNALVSVTEWPPSSGQTVGANAVIGKYTYLGDTNMDGQVTPQDYTAVDSNINATGIDLGIAWFYGDTNFDGNVDSTDYPAIDGALGLGVGSPLAATGAVPEPSTLAGIGVGVGWIASRRRQRGAAARGALLRS
jgi:hypothetical protein